MKWAISYWLPGQRQRKMHGRMHIVSVFTIQGSTQRWPGHLKVAVRSALDNHLTCWLHNCKIAFKGNVAWHLQLMVAALRFHFCTSCPSIKCHEAHLTMFMPAPMLSNAPRPL